jgi:hypothetical protein
MTSKGMLRFSRWFVTADVVTTSVPSVRRAARTRPSGTLRTPIRPRTRGLPVPTVHRLLTSLRGRGAEEASLREVEVVARSLDSFAPPLVRPAHLARFETALRAAAGRLTGRTLWHVNSTSEGGGVAELLHGLLGYLVAGGIRTRWLVVEGMPDFFRVTKRLHNRLHGSPGDSGPMRRGARPHLYMISERSGSSMA